MNFFKCTILLSFLFSGTSFAGGVTAGDGGHGVVCQQSYLYPEKNLVHLLDVYEYEKLFQDVHTYQFKGDSLYEDIDQLLDFNFSFMEGFPEDFLILVSSAKFDYIYFGQGSHVSSTDYLFKDPDFGSSFYNIESQCQIVQIAYSLSTLRRIEVAAAFWNSLSRLDQIALIIHEKLHFWFDQEEDTKAVRQVVWYLLGSTKFKAKNYQVIKKVIESKKAAALKDFNLTN